MRFGPIAPVEIDAGFASRAVATPATHAISVRKALPWSLLVALVLVAAAAQLFQPSMMWLVVLAIPLAGVGVFAAIAGHVLTVLEERDALKHRLIIR